MEPKKHLSTGDAGLTYVTARRRWSRGDNHQHTDTGAISRHTAMKTSTQTQSHEDIVNTDTGVMKTSTQTVAMTIDQRLLLFFI